MLFGVSGFRNCIQYADGTSIILSDLNHIQLSGKCQSDRDKLTAWLSKCDLKLTAQKLIFWIFTEIVMCQSYQGS